MFLIMIRENKIVNWNEIEIWKKYEIFKIWLKFDSNVIKIFWTIKYYLKIEIFYCLSNNYKIIMNIYCIKNEIYIYIYNYCK